MRTKDEVQKYRDISIAVSTGEVKIKSNPEVQTALAVVAQVLTWVLNNPKDPKEISEEFEENMRVLMKEISDEGYDLIELSQN